MPIVSRRTFFGSMAALGVGSRIGGAAEGKLRLGVTDWCLNLVANPLAVRVAAELGFDGVQISLEGKPNDDGSPKDDSEWVASYLQAAKARGIRIDGTSLDQRYSLNQRRVLDSIRLTKALGGRVLELPLFGPTEIRSRRQMERVGDILRDLGREAAKAEVILGLETSLSAEDNARILDRSWWQSVQVYYDVGNARTAGFDPVKEIRWLGSERICQFHLKDEPHFLGDGEIEFTPILQSIRDIGFSGYANLETGSPTGHLNADMSKNLKYLRKLMAQARQRVQADGTVRH